MEIEIPSKDIWYQYADEIESKIDAGCNEPELLEYFGQNPWILLAKFTQHCEGVCFKEYELCDEERPDFLLVHDGSFPDATMVEFKTPQTSLFNKKGNMSSKLNEAISSTIGRMFMCEIEYRHYYDRLSRQVDDLLSGRRRPYKGVYYGNIRKNFEVPFKKHINFMGKIIIGRDFELPREIDFRSGIARFLGKVEILTYDSILRQLRRYQK